MMKWANALAIAAILTLLSPSDVAGYIGPGAGLTVIGTAVAFMGALVLGVFGFIWYPVKRIYRAMRRGVDGTVVDSDG